MSFKVLRVESDDEQGCFPRTSNSERYSLVFRKTIVSGDSGKVTER